jgi:ribosomal protein S18 acetylase RimI-like enzyme
METHFKNLIPCPDSLSDGVIPLRLEGAESSLMFYERFGFVEAGSLGVRGLILDVRGESHEDRVYFLGQALRELRDDGTRRVHIIGSPDDDAFQAALSAGFASCPGENLFCRELATRPEIRNVCSSGHSLRDGTLRDLLLIQSELAHVPEVAFQGWENLLIGQGIGEANRFFKVIEHDDTIVGVSIGGSCQERGTISHTWVAEGHRNHKLGQILSDASVQALYDGGARCVHLMTVPNNVAAERFWEKQGFTREAEVAFLEIDI